MYIVDSPLFRASCLGAILLVALASIGIGYQAAKNTRSSPWFRVWLFILCPIAFIASLAILIGFYRMGRFTIGYLPLYLAPPFLGYWFGGLFYSSQQQ